MLYTKKGESKGLSPDLLLCLWRRKTAVQERSVESPRSHVDVLLPCRVAPLFHPLPPILSKAAGTFMLITRMICF